MIIGISGKKGAGKDTVGEFIRQLTKEAYFPSRKVKATLVAIPLRTIFGTRALSVLPLQILSNKLP